MSNLGADFKSIIIREQRKSRLQKILIKISNKEAQFNI